MPIPTDSSLFRRQAYREVREELLQLDTSSAIQKVFHIAWLAVLVGFLAQIAVAILKSCVQPGSFGAASFFIEMAQKMSWSAIVCVGLALALVSQHAKPMVTGMLGLLAAPLAVLVARTVQKSLSQALGLPVESPPLLLLSLVCLIKALQYMLLGYTLGWLSSRTNYSVWMYALAGLLAGTIFGTALQGTVYLLAVKVPTPLEMASRYLNEIIQPVGCALAYYAAERLANMLKLKEG
jgi:ABC-type xylose transport system permease subunit